MDCLITKQSHHFVVSDFSEVEKSIFNQFARKLIQFQSTRLRTGDIVRTPYKVFADSTLNPLTFRFHIEQLDEFIAYIESYGLRYDIVTQPMYEPALVDFPPVHERFQPTGDYEYQVPIIEYICNDNYKKVITLQTGRGKTAVFIHAMSRIGQRTALVLKPKYFERWIETIDSRSGKELLPLKAGRDVLTVRGSEELLSLINLALANELTASVIVISSNTYADYLTNYRVDGANEKYGMLAPDKLWELLKVGLVGVDEGHENFHANFKLDLYSHVPKIVTLSATLVPDDKFLQRMYEILYPSRLRMDGGAYIRYADMISVPYAIENLKQINTTRRGRTDYSHLAFEESLLSTRNKKSLNNVYEMIKLDVEQYFLKLRLPDHKLLIFFDSRAMCAEMEKRFKKDFPDLKIGKYTSDEDYSVLYELDIIIATTKSADTGVDIPRLQMVFCFVARGSTQSNMQMFGRLRQLKNQPRRPEFLYYYCPQITAHCNYHSHRQEVFKNKTVQMSERKTFCTI